MATLKNYWTYITVLFTVVCILNSNAQPSGWQYGPVKMSYKIPETKGKIYYVAPDGNPSVPGNQLTQPTTIENAIERVNTDDIIILRGGVYRTGNLTFNQGITIQPYANEQPVLKGTLEAKEWKQENDSLWSTQWQYLFPSTYESWWRRDHEEKYTPIHRFNNDVVFIDGEFLQSAGNKAEVNESTFFVDYSAKTIYIGRNPKGHLVEITAFRKAIFRTIANCHGKKSDGIGPKIYGVEITQYPDTTVHIDGFYPEAVSAEKDHGNDVKGTILENCDISNCFRIGVFTIGDSLIIRHCKISNTSREGLYVVASDDVLLENNIFTANNIENITGCFPAAVKIFNQSYRVTCRDNLIINLPNSNGVWYDVGNVDGVFINNWLQDIGLEVGLNNKRNFWPASGFFFEISKGVICAGNVFSNCGNGVLILNSSNARIYQNTFYNSAIGIGRTERSAVGDHFGWHPSTGPDVAERYGHVFVNNLVVVDKHYQRTLMNVWQAPVLCKKLFESPIKEMDYNIFVTNQDNNKTFMNWSPGHDTIQCSLAIKSLEDLQKVFNGSSVHSKVLSTRKLSVFTSADLNNFHLSPEFSETESGVALPDNIKKIIGLSSKYKPYIGAYPSK